jgi:peptidoglycan/LPS O-acetylase OafA/YrhL
MKPSSQYLSNLTPLRGIAALLTVIFHVDLMLGNGGDMLLKFKDSFLINRMYLMVDFFFILSGFIMCHVYGTWFAEGVSRNLFRQFTVARFARVYPLHLCTLLAVVLIFSVSGWVGVPESPILETENSLYSFITNVLLLQSMNLHQWFSWNHAAWSISTEWWMYMLFPFLVRPFMGLKSVGRVAVVLGCFVGYVAITLWLFQAVTITPALSFMFGNGPAPANNTINVAFQFGFVRCLCGFVLGMMMYAGYQENWGKNWLGNGYTFLVLTLGLGVCMHFAVADVFSVSFFPLMILSAAYGSQNLDAFLGTKPLQRLGDWSFSIYLVHQPLMFTIGSIMVMMATPSATAGPPTKPDMLTGWLMCFAFIALTLVVSYLTYHFVEVPARNWINKSRK